MSRWGNISRPAFLSRLYPRLVAVFLRSLHLAKRSCRDAVERNSFSSHLQESDAAATMLPFSILNQRDFYTTTIPFRRYLSSHRPGHCHLSWTSYNDTFLLFFFFFNIVLPTTDTEISPHNFTIPIFPHSN